MNTSKDKVAIILPAFNEEAIISKTLTDLKKHLKTVKNFSFSIVVINDGSTDKTKEKSIKLVDTVITHHFNQGLGAALATGLEFVRRKKIFKYAVTIDSDGQHDPRDIPVILKALKNNDVVIGSRFLNPSNRFPPYRKFVLKIGNLITYLFFGIWTSDSQSGFRGFNSKAINKIKLVTNQMEVSSEFFGEIKKHHLKFTHVPIKVYYTKYSLKKGQSHINSLNVLLKLMYKIFN